MMFISALLGGLIVLFAVCGAYPGIVETIRSEEREKLEKALRSLPPYRVCIEDKPSGGSVEIDIPKTEGVSEKCLK